MNLIPTAMQAPADVAEQRLATCRACPLRGQLPLTGHDYCTACGCPLASKTKFRNSTCPKGKWGKSP